MAEYIGMNKLKWLLLAVYGLYIILLRIPKLAILSKLPIKKDIYILSWYSGFGNNIIQLVQAEYLAERAGFTVHVPPHNFMKLENKYLMHDIKPMPLEQRPYFPKTSSSLFLTCEKNRIHMPVQNWLYLEVFISGLTCSPFLPA